MGRFAATFVLAVGLALGSTGAGAAGTTQGGDPAAAPEAKKPDKSKKICRTIVKSGTRFSTRYCRSQEDWDKDAEHSQRYLEEGQIYGYRKDGEMNTQSGVNTGPR